MKLTVSHIPPEGRDIEDEASVDTGDGAPARVSMHLRVERVEEDVFVHGDASAHVPLSCSRCLKEFEEDVEFSLDLSFFPAEEEGEEEASDENITYYRDDEIDLGESVREQLLLNLPLKPLCQEDCKGICPSCGKDLNVESCDCEKKAVDPRMAALKKLLDKGKE